MGTPGRVPKMSNKLVSFFPRRSVSDHDDSNRCIGQSEISRGTRTEDRDYRMSP